MIYGYARVSTDGQSVETQIGALTAAGTDRVFREVASGAKNDRAQLRRMLDSGDMVMVTRLDLLHTLKAVADKGAGFRSLADIVDIEAGWSMEPIINDLKHSGWISASMKAVLDAAYLNKRATKGTAISVVLGSASSVVGAIAS